MTDRQRPIWLVWTWDSESGNQVHVARSLTAAEAVVHHLIEDLEDDDIKPVNLVLNTDALQGITGETITGSGKLVGLWKAGVDEYPLDTTWIAITQASIIE